MGDPVYTFVLPRGTATSGKDSILTELRIHGVSGPDPAGVLESPAVFHVAGDQVTGFARRLHANSFGTADVVDPDWPNRRLEAFSWRGVSSGSGIRALWLLLTPFALLNVSYWMHPVLPYDDSDLPQLDPWNAPRVARLDRLLRAMAVGLTLLVTLATLAATLDVPARSTRPCPASLGHAMCGWLRHGSLPTRLLGALAALAVVGLLAILSVFSWRKYDANSATTGSEYDPRKSLNQPDFTTPLSSPAFWKPKRCAKQQQRVHVASALLLVVWVTLQPSVGPRWVGLTVLVGLIVGAMFVGSLPQLSIARDLGSAPAPQPPLRTGGEADRAHRSPTHPLDKAMVRPNARENRWSTVGIALALTLVGVAAIAALVIAALQLTEQRAQPPAVADLYRMRDAVAVILTMLTLVAFLIAWVVVGMARRSTTNRNHDPLLFRLASLWMSWLALFVGVILSSSVVLSADKIFITKKSYVVTPGFSQLINIGAAVLVVTAALVIAAAIAFWGWSFLAYRTDTIVSRVMRPGDQSHYRRACATAHFTRNAYRGVILLSVSGLTWVTVSAVYIGAGLRAWAIPSLTALLTAGLSGLFTLLLAVYRSVGDRRMIGVVWDVTTFWPRAVHPWAPPCYAERAVPQLVDRVVALRGTGPVIVSGHSQGAMISSAVIQQLSPLQREELALVTYGCQLSFLFARAFPSYAGGFVLDQLADDLGVPPAGPLGDHIYSLRWLNLYRLTDLLGSRVSLSPRYAEINREVADPRYARYRPAGPPPPVPSRTDPEYSLQIVAWPMTGDTISSAKPLGHSNYPASYEYRGAAYFLDTALRHGTP